MRANASHAPRIVLTVALFILLMPGLIGAVFALACTGLPHLFGLLARKPLPEAA